MKDKSAINLSRQGEGPGGNNIELTDLFVGFLIPTRLLVAVILLGMLHKLSNITRQDSGQWHDIHLHSQRCHHAQRAKCSHNLQGKTHFRRRLRQAWKVPYPISATTQTTVTTLPIEESMNSTSTSKQRLRSLIN